ncbi:MAG TPA: putative 2OG-Fe(II) oxygenase [Rhizomicrobium sp.]|nr:putative 2OG-Fe(II) oxygenase [Rhizomicrobium sp.]
MATPKPQIRSTFATPVCVHFVPVAPEMNPELRARILEHMQAGGPSNGPGGPRGHGWRSRSDFESWGGQHAQTLARVLRELADGLTATRSGGRVTLDWKIAACAAVRGRGDNVETGAHPGAFWAGVYFADDGYAKSDDQALGGEVELCDPRGALPAMVAPHLAFRIPGGGNAGQTEIIRPQAGMIVMHPAWQPRGERRLEADGQRVTVEFELAVP